MQHSMENIVMLPLSQKASLPVCSSSSTRSRLSNDERRLFCMLIERCRITPPLLRYCRHTRDSSRNISCCVTLPFVVVYWYVGGARSRVADVCATVTFSRRLAWTYSIASTFDHLILLLRRKGRCSLMAPLKRMVLCIYVYIVLVGER